MIGIVDVQIAAHNPAMPLFPMRAFLNSPSSVRIRNVPKQIGSWKISKVFFQATYPDGSVKSVDCILVGGIWVGTISGATTVGNVQNGYTVYADGVDENNNAVNGYILGKGDVQILESDGTIVPGQTLCYVHMLSAEPSEPKAGDLWQVSGSWYVYQDGQAWPIGDDSGLITQLSGEISAKADLSSLSGCMRLCPSQPEHPVEGDVWYEPFQRVTWVWHNNEWLDFAASPYYVSRQLTYYERKDNMKSDVSSIVTAKAFTDWDYPAEIDGKYYAPDTDWLNEHGDHDKTYYVMRVEYVGEGPGWLIEISPYAWWDDPDFGSWQPQGMYEQTVDAPEDTLSLTLVIPEELGGGTLTLTREQVNEIGLAMMSDLSAKQDKLTDPQISAIDSVVDERATTITFDGGSTSTYDWAGEINRQTLVDAGIYDDTEQTWLMYPTTINFGAGVTGIGASAFAGCGTLGTVTIPDSVTSIGASAFSGCDALANVKIGNGLKNVGDYAFQNCSNLGQVTLPANVNPPGVDAFSGTLSYFKLYLEEAVPTFVPGAANYPWGVANTANIITVRSASKEWVEEQAYGKGFVWRNATVNSRLNTCSINAFNINALTLSAARASFKVTLNATAYNTARDMYFALTIGNFTQPMTWDTPFDVFKGGSAEAVAPTEGLNFYHIFEYASGHFMVEKII